MLSKSDSAEDTARYDQRIYFQDFTFRLRFSIANIFVLSFL